MLDKSVTKSSFHETVVSGPLETTLKLQIHSQVRFVSGCSGKQSVNKTLNRFLFREYDLSY